MNIFYTLLNDSFVSILTGKLVENHSSEAWKEVKKEAEESFRAYIFDYVSVEKPKLAQKINAALVEGNDEYFEQENEVKEVIIEAYDALLEGLERQIDHIKDE